MIKGDFGEFRLNDKGEKAISETIYITIKSISEVRGIFKIKS